MFGTMTKALLAVLMFAGTASAAGTSVGRPMESRERSERDKGDREKARSVEQQVSAKSFAEADTTVKSMASEIILKAKEALKAGKLNEVEVNELEHLEHAYRERDSVGLKGQGVLPAKAIKAIHKKVMSGVSVREAMDQVFKEQKIERKALLDC